MGAREGWWGRRAGAAGESREEKPDESGRHPELELRESVPGSPFVLCLRDGGEWVSKRITKRDRGE